MYRKKSTLLFLAFILFLSTFIQFTSPRAGLADTSGFAGGSGTANDPWVITTPQQLDNVRNDLSAHYKLGNDIDLSSYVSSGGAGYHAGAGWEPIGDNTNPFNGTFNGQGHRIIGLQINRPLTDYVGLFGSVGPGGRVQNVGMQDDRVNGLSYAGGLAGNNTGSIANAYAAGSVNGSNLHNGGLVGYNDMGGSIVNSYASCSVSGDRGTGGLAGSNTGSITNAYATGNVNGRDGTGGLVGYDFGGSITDTYAAGHVSGSTSVGGLVGIDFIHTIQNSFYNSETSGQSDTGKGTPKTTAEMKTQSTYTDAGWDFSGTWGINPTINEGYPFFTPSYTVVYNDNGSTSGSVPTDSNTYKENNTVTVLNNTGNLKKDGYTFDGWNTKADGSGTSYTPGDQITMGPSNVTLYAQWVPIKWYYVQYNGNGNNEGNIPPQSPLTAPGATLLILGNIGELSRTGYSFAGWNTKLDGSGTSYMPGDQITMGQSNVTLYARWTANRYTVSFDSNGGSAVSDQTVNYGDQASQPSDPARTGYTFAGWYTDINLTKVYDFGTKITADTQLYAKWTVNRYTVSFDSNGGSAVGDQTVNYGDQASQPSDPARTGYTFAGWYADSSLTKVFDFSAKITADTQLYAKWTVNSYTVSFDSNGGSAVGGQTVNYGDQATQPSDPARAGYTFAGWYADSNLTKVFDFSTKITADTQLYAKWTINRYTVSFDSNGGSAVGGQTVNYGDQATQPSDPARTGYTFAGWYADSSLTKVFDFSTKITADTQLYAKWTVNRYTVSFNSNGGSATPEINADYGDTISAPSVPTQTGYTFAGWYKDKDLTMAWDFEKDTVTQDTTLYAKWTVNSYSVTYDGNGNNRGSVPAEKTYPYNGSFTVSGNTGELSRTGYTFAGWNTGMDGSGTTYTPDSVFTMGAANVALYALWNINNDIISFDSNGGSIVNAQTVRYGDLAGKPSDPVRAGYTFSRWYADSSLTKIFDFSTKITADTQLYAKWTANRYTVSFDSNGGSAVGGQTVNYGDQATQPSDPARTGYTFAGWYADSSLTKVFDFSTKITADTKLHAKWVINGFSINHAESDGINIVRAASHSVKKVFNESSEKLAGSTEKDEKSVPAVLQKSQEKQTVKSETRQPKHTDAQSGEKLSQTAGSTNGGIITAGVLFLTLAGGAVIIFLTRRRKHSNDREQ
ncbi:InlB B-repeat-containing protein [Sporolactobacillus putidus]|uniref:GLUG domain-containing protein n=1 Tax=Sporolactobacillus putidus TaxID=492735 RepID=A0A917W487_9BACL|nr:InlB B-repeat-containing protein [Sporolactobacillus putidus]GGL61789.1 hypothetical protein GCM10007968_27220 [Sporolactobacillus putidus]